MIRTSIVLAIARAELRLTRRLVRFWVFQSLAFLIGALGCAYYTVLHVFTSSTSASVAVINPRYLMGFVGIYYIVVFLLGLIFLGFDVRARDTRERMAEVLDALPCSNLEVLIGRYLGILVAGWVPLVATCAILLLAGWLAGSPIQVHSLITFAVVMAVPAYTFTIGLVFFLSLLLRHRGLVAIAALALLGGLIAANFAFVPIYMLPLADVTGGFSVPWPSDFAPKLTDGHGALQRLAYLLAGLGLIWLAAAVHPRQDDGSRAGRATVGAAMLLVGLGLVAGLSVTYARAIEQRKLWAERHRARASEPVPDLQSLRGTVRIEPGRRLSMDLELEIRAPSDRPLDSALFSLNPGLRVQQALRDGRDVEPRQADGLIDIPLPDGLAPGATATFGLRIEGALDERFTFIEAAFDPLAMSIRSGNTFLLGFEPFVFERRYVALLPGARWLPATGTEVGRDDPGGRAQDFFEVDLTIDVPAEWRVAGPGRRQAAPGAEGGRERQRFAPPAPVPDVALVAGRFASRSVEVEGVALEVLMHEDHAKNLEVLAPAAGEVRDWLAEHLQEAAEIGLPYPYDGLTLVEVPGDLRGYGGGWRMGSTFMQPAMILTRETGFPTARFDFRFKDPEKFEEREGGMPRAMRETLESFFETDFAGGNPFVAGAQNFFGFQTAGFGPETMPLDFVCEDLSSRLVTDKRGYFSVHHFGADMGQVINRVMPAIFNNEGGNMTDVIINAITSRSEVWDQVLGVSLRDLEPWDDPKVALDVLTLKGSAMADSMLDALGREKAGRLLGDLRQGRGVEGFTREDVVQAGHRVGEDLETWLDVWIDSTELPGFILGPVDLVRIKDDANGLPRYQLTVVLHDGEKAPGLARLQYRVGKADAPRQESEPVHVGAGASAEIGIVTSEPPLRVLVAPYLSLNREPFSVPLPELVEAKVSDQEPFSGVRASDWRPPETGAIVVDDLDPGFSVDETAARSFFRFGGTGDKQETDVGLPVYQERGPPARWSRTERSDAFGRYRHTLAVVRAGKGQRRAIFATELPRDGSWTLAYHVPSSYVPKRETDDEGGPRRSRLGGLALKLVHASGSRDLEFNAAGAETGWNDVGEFDLEAGEVRLELSDASDGRVVVADAIRWTPAPRRAALDGRR